MIHPAEVELRAYRGGGAFVDVTDFEAFDYSDAAFALEIRRYRDASGPPLVTIATAGSTAEGVSAEVIAADPLPVSSVRIQINETTLEALPFTTPRGGDLTLFYALDITGGGHGKKRRMQGRFILEASANG